MIVSEISAATFLLYVEMVLETETFFLSNFEVVSEITEANFKAYFKMVSEISEAFLPALKWFQNFPKQLFSRTLNWVSCFL